MTHHAQNLQWQLNHLRQDLNNILQMASQLSQQEQSNAMELRRLQQLESNASQQLQRIQQICSSLSNSLNQVSGITQQYGTGMQAAGAQFTQQQPYTGQFTQQYQQPYATQFTQQQPYTAQTGTAQFGGGFNMPQYGTGAYAQNLGQYSAGMNFGNFGANQYSTQAFSPMMSNLGNPSNIGNIGNLGNYAALPSAYRTGANYLQSPSMGAYWTAPSNYLNPSISGQF